MVHSPPHLPRQVWISRILPRVYERLGNSHHVSFAPLILQHLAALSLQEYVDVAETPGING